jgi:hypothetical protein
MNILEKAFVKGDDLMTRNIAGETLIVPVRNRVGDLSSIYTLNEVGARVWQLLDGRTPLAEIVRAITGEYEVTADEAAADISELILDWETAGLVRAVAA